MQTDRYQPLRDALAMGPTPGPWRPSYDKGSTRDIFTEQGKLPVCMVRGVTYVGQEQYLANGHFIAAADPDTIAALLKERDALRDALSEAQTRIAAIGYPASPDGEYSKDGEWTFSDAVPRAVDAEEVKAAFLVIRAALADGEDFPDMVRRVERLRADAERYRFLAERCRSTSEHWGGRWSVVIDGPAPASHNSKDDFDAAIDKAMEATNGS